MENPFIKPQVDDDSYWSDTIQNEEISDDNFPSALIKNEVEETSDIAEAGPCFPDASETSTSQTMWPVTAKRMKTKNESSTSAVSLEYSSTEGQYTSKAAAILPDGLCFIENNEVETGHVERGVWCTVSIPKGTVWGPYPNELTVSNRNNTGNADFEWTSSLRISSMKKECNTKHVRMSGTQCYWTIKNIPPGSEIVVTNKLTNPKSGMNMHRNQDTDSGEYCSRSNNSKDHNSHHDLECIKDCERPEELRKEQLLQHLDSFPCAECNKTFRCIRSLQRHQFLHSGVKPHSCPVCGRDFARSDKLVRHSKIHTGEKPHTCLDCGKGFSRLDKLKSHRVIHSAEKPHICHSCGKSYKHAQSLKMHACRYRAQPNEFDVFKVK